MICIDRLGVCRHETWLFRQLCFQVLPGEHWLFMGSNGTGKTTLLKLLAGLCVPDEGTLQYHDEQPDLLYLSAPPATVPELSVRDNLRFYVLLRWGKQLEPTLLAAALRHWRLGSLLDKSLSTLSTGQQQRVALACLMLGPAKLWLLDEPTTALDTAGVSLLWTLCHQFQQQGGSIIMATHQAPPYPHAYLRHMRFGVSLQTEHVL